MIDLTSGVDRLLHLPSAEAISARPNAHRMIDKVGRFDLRTKSADKIMLRVSCKKWPILAVCCGSSILLADFFLGKLKNHAHKSQLTLSIV